jgi:hypothetical protein
MRFAAAWPSYQDQIGAAFDPAIASADRHDVGLGDHRHRVEVEAVEGLAGQKSGVCQMPLDTSPIALGDLMLGKRGEEAGRRPAFLVGLLGDGWPALLDGGQAQIVEDEPQARDVDGRVHAATLSGQPSRTS